MLEESFKLALSRQAGGMDATRKERGSPFPRQDSVYGLWLAILVVSAVPSRYADPAPNVVDICCSRSIHELISILSFKDRAEDEENCPARNIAIETEPKPVSGERDSSL